MKSSNARFLAPLLAIVLMGALVRAPLLTLGSQSYRLSEAFNIEDVENVRISTGMLNKHTFNPHAFEYPSLFYYLSVPVELALRKCGHSTWHDLLIGVRSLSLLFGLGTIVCVALIARRLSGPMAGLIAASIVALDRTLIDTSTLAKPNGAQLFFLLAAFLALISIAERPRVATAAAAAALLALATASKWLGALGLAGLALAPLLATDSAVPNGVRRLKDTLSRGLAMPVPIWKTTLPLLVFLGVFLACVPFAVLSPREFAFGLAQTFTAQSAHHRDVPIWTPLIFALRSLGPMAAALSVFGIGSAVVRLGTWSGTTAERGRVLVLGWALAYGALVLFVFVRLPSYIDLWIPFLAILAACACVAERGVLAGRTPRALALAAVLIGGMLANGAYANARAHVARNADTREAAGAWLNQHAGERDSVLADLGTYVPDRLTNVRWNWWGSPPRIVYDESVTWGSDPEWPAWYGGHRRLIFENAKWQDAESLLAARPRWVLTSDEWSRIRAHPEIASEAAAPGYDRALQDGSAGYTLRAGWTPAPAPANPWRALSLLRRGTNLTHGGPAIRIYERTR
jgi:4-amino-4-deoxy-L-arabinose transferase-like glycosyltransferase